MPIRFQADADLNQIIVSAVVRRVPDIDFKTATSAGLAGLKDQEVLDIAARDGRVLVTHDQKTMPRHFGEFLRSERSPGLLVVPQHLPRGEVAADLTFDLDDNRGGGMDKSDRLPADLSP